MIGKTDPVYNIEFFAVIGKQPAQKRCLLNYVNCRLRGTAFRRGAGPGAIFVWIACPDVIDLKWTGLLWWRFYTNDQLRSSHATHTNNQPWTLNLESWILNHPPSIRSYTRMKLRYVQATLTHALITCSIDVMSVPCLVSGPRITVCYCHVTSVIKAETRAQMGFRFCAFPSLFWCDFLVQKGVAHAKDR